MKIYCYSFSGLNHLRDRLVSSLHLKLCRFSSVFSVSRFCFCVTASWAISVCLLRGAGWDSTSEPPVHHGFG